MHNHKVIGEFWLHVCKLTEFCANLVYCDYLHNFFQENGHNFNNNKSIMLFIQGVITFFPYQAQCPLPVFNGSTSGQSNLVSDLLGHLIGRTKESRHPQDAKA